MSFNGTFNGNGNIPDGFERGPFGDVVRSPTTISIASKLRDAIYSNNIRALREILPNATVLDIDSGDEDSRGWTPLIVAARYNRCDAIEALLADNASVEKADADGFTPLCNAAAQGHCEAIAMLAEAGARTESDQFSALLCAVASAGALSAVQLLLELGADPFKTIANAQPIVTGANSYDRTVLVVAAMDTDVSVVRALYEAMGSNEERRREHAQDALSLARINLQFSVTQDKQDIVSFLESCQ